jgi:hypothetical protein
MVLCVFLFPHQLQAVETARSDLPQNDHFWQILWQIGFFMPVQSPSLFTSSIPRSSPAPQFLALSVSPPGCRLPGSNSRLAKMEQV